MDYKTKEIAEDTNCCAMCKRMIINAGIKEVIVRTDKNNYKVICVQDWIDNDDSLDLIDTNKMTGSCKEMADAYKEMTNAYKEMLDSIESPDNLCEYCPWTKKQHNTESLCESFYCYQAKEIYVNQLYLKQ